MNKFSSKNHKEYCERLERYRSQKNAGFFVIDSLIPWLLIGFLLILSLSQLAILNKGLGNLFELDSDQIFSIPSKTLISLLVTTFLPIASFIDESGILLKRLKFLGIPLIWFLFLADIYLTFIAMLNVVPNSDDNWRAVTSLVIAAVLSISTLFISKTIIKNLYKREIYDQKVKYIQKIQGLEDKLIDYKEYSDSMRELKKNFNPVKKLIVDFASQSKNILEKLSSLDESVKELNFPQPPQIDISEESNNEVVEKRTYYLKNYGKSEEDLRLPSELSPVAYLLFEAIQNEHLPKPIVREYAPKQGLPKCLVLDFDDYNVVVYCRDEEFKGKEKKWTPEDEINFKSRFNQHTVEGIQSLVFTAEEIMNNPSKVSAQIKDVIDSKV